MWKETIREISAFGGTPIYVAIMAAFLFTNNLTEFYQLFIGLALAYAVVMAIRFTYWTKRPDHKTKPKTIWEKFDKGSFPSMHVIRVTILAIVIALFFNNLYVTIGLLIAVLITTWTRVHLRRHYVHDVLAGKLLGVAIAWITITYLVPLI